MNYKDAVEYMFNIPRFAKKTSLQHTEALLKHMCVTNEDKKIIHVAGTNGKGSVCTYLNEILLKNGLHTGLFTSPHLVKANERIRIDGKVIDDEEFLHLFDEVKKATDKMCEDGYEKTTFFEFIFAMSMLCFKEHNVDYIILETGLGGRYDQTNVVKNPVLTIITEVGLDHMEYLGDTFEKIAYQKAGIIKQSVPVVFYGERKEVSCVIEEEAVKKHAPFYRLTDSMMRIIKKNEKSIDFSLHYSYYESGNLSVDSVALYQVCNASLAYMGSVLLKDVKSFDGHFKSLWEGRMECVKEQVYVDGAHNDDGIDAFVDTVKTMDGEKILLFSVVSDKDYTGMIEKLCKDDIFTKYYITKINGSRATDTAVLRELFEKNTKRDVYVYDDIRKAFEHADADKGSATLFCAGSLYLVGSIKEIIK